MKTHRSAPAMIVVGVLALLGLAGPAAAQAPYARPIALDGFGQAQNSFAWSMAWFKGKLYVGTARNEWCVEDATFVFYYPIVPWLYNSSPAPGVTCPANEYDLNLQAEIWQYTPETNTWRRVFVSLQDIPNPRAPGKFVARDLGFRGMVVYHGELYVGGVTPDEYIPELANGTPPRILRTSDGRRFASIDAPDTIHTRFGAQKPMGFRAMTVYDNRLFVTSSAGLAGDGVVLEVHNPAGPKPTFTQINPPDLDVFELQPFDGHLYAGTATATQGYGVWRTDAKPGSPSWTPVVTGGAGRGEAMTSVVSMAAYRGKLYVGSAGWFSSAWPASELISISPNGDWDVVAGAPRMVGTQMKYPTSGLPDGFGNPFTAHFWRMEVFDGGLFIGTNDWSWLLTGVPVISDALQGGFGFDVWGTCGGQYWFPLTIDAFGRGLSNFGARAMLTTPFGAAVGSANDARGTTIFRSTAAWGCGGSTMSTRRPSADSRRPATVAGAVGAPARPGRLLADVQRCGTVVSWQRTAGAARYEVLRSTPRTFLGVPLPWRPPHLNGVVPDSPPGLSDRRASLTADLAPTVIGTTTRPFFVDHASPVGSMYEVVAEPTRGRASAPSNLDAAPSLRAPATFLTARGALRRMQGTRAVLAAATAPAILSDAQARWYRGDRTGAIAALARLQRTVLTSAVMTSARATQDRGEVGDLIYRLERRLQYSGVACAY